MKNPNFCSNFFFNFGATMEELLNHRVTVEVDHLVECTRTHKHTFMMHKI